MRVFYLVMLLLCFKYSVKAQDIVRGQVLSENTTQPISNVSIKLESESRSYKTDDRGFFIVEIVNKDDYIEISHIGYEPIEIPVSDFSEKVFIVFLRPKDYILEEVILNTGFQEITQERVTGSYSYIDEVLLNRNTGTDIISRLEGVTSGLSFDRSTSTREFTPQPKIRVRGITTLHSNESPLIILNNFPFEGDIEDINPNDVESVTVLKDATAASIWGARAGNGVIVVKTKTGKTIGKPEVNFMLNTKISQKPDLFYNPNFLPSAERMALEDDYFLKNLYSQQDNIPIPEYIELIIANKDGLISNEEFERERKNLLNTDIREEATKHLYQSGVSSQYALNFRGSTQTYSYYLSGGYDKVTQATKGNGYKRLTFNSANTFKLVDQLELQVNVFMNQGQSANNGQSLASLNGSGLTISPYTRLLGEDGEALAIPYTYRTAYTDNAIELGLLDWGYRPLEELNQKVNKNMSNDTRIMAGLRYDLSSGLFLNFLYQYEKNANHTRNLYNEDTYYSRNLINRYTQADGLKIIPQGSVLEGGSSNTLSHSGRIQVNFNDYISKKNYVSAIAGTEIREQLYNVNPPYKLYGYDENRLTASTVLNYEELYPVRPQGRARIPAVSGQTSHILDRYLSYYLNASNTFDDKFVLSFSSRWDASNLFGVKTNQKGIPLWSIGGSWILNNEKFYNINWLPYLRTRLTYGYNGNVNKNVSTYPIIRFTSDSSTDYRRAILSSTGNPNLRWEKIKTINMGLDFRLFENTIIGSLDLYKKSASDLIGINTMDPTTGVFPPEIHNLINYANMESKGMDLEITSNNLKGKVNWRTTFFVNFTKNKVTNYMANDATSVTQFFPSNVYAPAVVNVSRDAIYGLPWNGLSKDTGMPIVFIDGEESTNYVQYINGMAPQDLEPLGVTVPTKFGSILNSFAWKNLTLSANLIWKAGYKFRRSSINYSLLKDGSGHIDYLKRWVNAGDELITNVPAFPDDSNPSRDQAYLYSETLIENGNHIRLQDLFLNYDLKGLLKRSKFSNLNVFFNASNLGIIWRANKHNLDPDYPNSSYPSPLTTSLGINVKF